MKNKDLEYDNFTIDQMIKIAEGQQIGQFTDMEDNKSYKITDCEYNHGIQALVQYLKEIKAGDFGMDPKDERFYYTGELTKEMCDPEYEQGTD